jgi:RNA polymerase sigma-70 factor, ECF subfamily
LSERRGAGLARPSVAPRRPGLAILAGRAPGRRPPRAASRAERRLAARLRRGDPAALDAVYAEHGAITFGYLLGALGDRAAAEDVQQEVFLDVWRRAATFDPARGGLATWIMTIARSRLVDHLRRRVPEPTDPAGAAALAERSGEPEDETEALHERWLVAGLLRRLPPEEARLLRLRFYEGLSQREIAERTDIPLGTVKMRMVQALERLRTALELEGETA